MKEALDRHRRGLLSEAEAIYHEILQQVPSHFDALHNLGVLALQRQDNYVALDFFKTAHAINPEAAPLHLNIGNALWNLQRPTDALQSYDKALSLRSDWAEAYSNRATVLRHLNRNEEAVLSADRAIAIRPDYMEAHLNRAHAMDTLKRYEEAIFSYQEAARCGGNKEEIRYYLAALGAQPAPKKSPLSYVESLFDLYAERFDSSLLGLGYGIPKRLFDVIVADNPRGNKSIADLGCGTGMCGPHLRTIARSLVGVDLSEKMLDKARERAIYDRLIKTDLIRFLEAEESTFDLLVAADVLIYLGDLDPVFEVARKALRYGGHFAFSVESCEGDGFTIRPTRRFAHSKKYLRALAAKHGFAEKEMIPAVIRMEEGKNTDGFIILLQPE